MGIVEQELASFELSNGQQHRIELNTDGTIHLHMGNVRLDMTPEEFNYFARIVSRAETELRRRKNEHE